jgi:DNA-binding transcriptional LysR family regulator
MTELELNHALGAYSVIVEFRELHWFTTLAECQHVTEAALQLNISQPTLSRAVARLERRLGVHLFNRHQNRLHLNRYGEVFCTHALRAIGEISTAEQRIASLIDADKGTIALGFRHSFGGWLVPDLLQAYRSVAPATTFELRGYAADVVVAEVRNRSLDIGLTSPRPAGDDLRWLPMLEERLKLLVSEAHPLAGRAEVGAAELGDEGFVVFPRVFGVRQVADRLCFEAGFKPRVVIEGTELSTVQALVAAKLGIAIVPESRPNGRLYPGTVEVPLSDPGARRPIGMVTIADGPAAPAARRFCTFVADRVHASDT